MQHACYLHILIQLSNVDKELLMNNNRHKVHISVNLLLIKENSVLLSLRHNTELSENCYGLIAGHLEPEESVTSAMIREAKEELGIDIKKSDLNFTSIIHYPHKPDYIDFFFKCCKWHGEIKNMEPNKCRELLFLISVIFQITLFNI